MSRVVAKIGTSSITAEDGRIDESAIARFCAEIAAVRARGHQIVIVTSAAISAGVCVATRGCRLSILT